MSIVRFGRYIPTSLREWDRVFEQLNQVIRLNETGVEITADNLPPQDASYVTLSNNASLTNDRVLTGATGEVTVTDYGAGDRAVIGLPDTVAEGSYTNVTVDAKGRVTAGTLIIYQGSGNPEGAVVAPIGSLYLNLLGGATTTLYVKTSGSGASGWTVK